MCAREPSLRSLYNAISEVMGPVWVAQNSLLFTKHGVNVELKYFAATTAVQAMVAGAEDIGLVGNQGVDAKLSAKDSSVGVYRFDQ